MTRRIKNGETLVVAAKLGSVFLEGDGRVRSAELMTQLGSPLMWPSVEAMEQEITINQYVPLVVTIMLAPHEVVPITTTPTRPTEEQ
jgi:hypothetical protein